MIDTTSNNMKDTVLHKIFNVVNSQPRKNINVVVHGIGNINTELAIKSIIQEKETEKNNIDNFVFERMTKIESILGKSELNVLLRKYCMLKTAELQSVKDEIKEAIQS